MTWMLAWHHFLEVRLGRCVECWVDQKATPNSLANIFAYINQDPTLMIVMKLNKWDLVSMLGLSNMLSVECVSEIFRRVREME